MSVIEILVSPEAREPRVREEAEGDYWGGVELYPVDEVVIKPGEVRNVKTGVSIALPEEFTGEIGYVSGYDRFRLPEWGRQIDNWKKPLELLVENPSQDDLAIHPRSAFAQIRIYGPEKVKFNLGYTEEDGVVGVEEEVDSGVDFGLGGSIIQFFEKYEYQKPQNSKSAKKQAEKFVRSYEEEKGKLFKEDHNFLLNLAYSLFSPEEVRR